MNTRESTLRTPVRALKGCAAALLALSTSSCVSQPNPDAVRAVSRVETPESPRSMTSLEELRAESSFQASSTPAEATSEYLLGPGDGIRVTVLGQAELSGEHTLGPDGCVAFPLIGNLELRGSSRADAALRLLEGWSPYFAHPPAVTVAVTRYENNKAFVLGRVERPGAVDLTGAGTLLQVLSEAGGLPVREFRSFLSQCSIIRGRDQILWIDLVELLQNGNTALNVPLRNGDVVFIPDSEDAVVYAMGEVGSPGAIPIKVRLDLVQALAHAGGTTEDADLESVYVIRAQGRGGFEKPLQIDLEHLIETADFRENVELQAGDIVFVARNGLGNANYVLRKLQPAVSALTLGAAIQ